MRIRTIKPEFWQSESVGRLSRDARLLFIALWSFADDSGRGRGAFPAISGQLFPFDEGALKSLPVWFAELEAEGMVRRYQIDGTWFFDIPKWLQHQKIEKASKSRLPPFPESSPNTPRPFEKNPPLDLGPRTLDQTPLSLTDVNDPAPDSVSEGIKLASNPSPTEQAPTNNTPQDATESPQSGAEGATSTHMAGDSQKPVKTKPDAKPDRRTEQTREVVSHYLGKLEAYRKTQGRWNGQLPGINHEHQSWKAVAKALKAGNTVEGLCQAIDGMFSTPHNIGKNDRGEEYLGLHLAVRDTNVERFQANAQAPPTGPHRDYKLGWHPGSPASEFIDGVRTFD
jgi:hypothetical protein